MKKILYNLLLCALLSAGLACNSNTGDTAEEGKAPVSHDDPKAPTVSPDKPTTDVGGGLEDSVQAQESEKQ